MSLKSYDFNEIIFLQNSYVFYIDKIAKAR